MIKTVIFDIGNVLMRFDWFSYVDELFGNKELAEKVTEALFKDQTWNELDLGIPEDEVLQHFIANAPELEAPIRLVLEHVGGCLHKLDYPIGWITELRERGYMVLYLSNYSETIMKANWDCLDFLPHMDGGVFSCDVHMIKPNREIYQFICDKYDLDSSECVFLDDTEVNIIAARDFGMNGIIFKGYEEGKAELDKLLAEDGIN